MYRWVMLLFASTWSLNAASVDLKDPTAPPAFLRGADASIPGTTKGTGVTHLVLSEILMSPGSHFAVINGRRVQAGEEIDGARVTSISYGGVELDRGGQTIELKLLPLKVKTAIGMAGRDEK